jgi:valyl-tRNA synthetase
MSLMTQPWPKLEVKLNFEEAQQKMEKLQEIIISLRNLKSEMGLAPAVRPKVILRTEEQDSLELLTRHSDYIVDLAGVESPEISSNAHKPQQSASSLVSDVEIYLVLEGLVNLEEERQRLNQETQKLSSLLRQTKSRLENRVFLAKAPASVVERERGKKEDLELRLVKIKRNLEALK